MGEKKKTQLSYLTQVSHPWCQCIFLFSPLYCKNKMNQHNYLKRKFISKDTQLLGWWCQGIQLIEVETLQMLLQRVKHFPHSPDCPHPAKGFASSEIKAAKEIFN